MTRGNELPVQSVIIPTYNRKGMLSEAIDSVRQQSLRNLEIIVVDDGSRDGTEDFVKGIPDERIRFFANESNSGSERSRNLGLSHARGKYITFLDDDDYYTDYEFFAKAVEIHENSKTPLAIVCCDAMSRESDTGITKVQSPMPLGQVRGREFILKQGGEYHKPLSLFPAVFRADILRQAGLANMMIFDSQTYMLAALYGDVHIMPGTIGIYRIHSESNSLGRKKSKPYNSRRYANLSERLRQDAIIRAKLHDTEDAKAAQKWYTTAIMADTQFFLGHSRNLADSFNIYRTLYEHSDFIPRLWPILFYRRLKANFFTMLRNIPGLRKLWRYFKYGESL